MAVEQDPTVTGPVFVEAHSVHRAASFARASGPRAAATHAPAKSVNVGRVIHRALRGRYTISIILGILLGGAAGIAAWRLGHPMFDSQGLIRIANSRPIVVQSNDINGGMAPTEFDSFMQTQKQVICSRRVMDVAVSDPVWSAMGKTVPQPPDQFFANYMKVEVRPRSEVIQITVSDRDPGTAAAAVTSIVNAFNDYYRRDEERTDSNRDGALHQNMDALKADIERFSALVEVGAKRFGGSDAGRLCDQAVEQVARLTSDLGSVRAAIAAAPASVPSGTDARPQSAQVGTDLTADQLAMSDPAMRALLDERLHAEQELRRLSSRYGPAYPQVITAKESLDDVNARIARQTVLDNDYRQSMPQNLTGPNSQAQGLIGRPLPELKEIEQNLQKQLNDATQRMNSLADERLKLEQNQEKLAQAKQDLEKVEARLESVKREGAVGGRLEVVSSGDVPISPARDIRPRLAAGAALGGLLTPAGLIVLYSLVRRKYRYADDTDAEGSTEAVPLLGILPELRKSDADVESLATASHCVHQIRMSVNASSSQAGSRAYLVTSATAGEGKTTLTMSLGLSFAASRVRTLIIDADLVGRKLTSAFQAREVEGLHESITAGTIRQRVRRTDSGLYILTAGKAGASDACAIPKAAIRAVIAEARTYFDVILVDSGPIMGSLEASILAPEVDGVIFAITRGQGRQAADVAIRRLRGLGATVVGCVFNRAKPHDLEHSSYGSSSRMSLPDPAQKVRAVNPFVGEGFGPVVQAVAAAMPESQN